MKAYISLVNKSFEFVGFDTNIVRAYGAPHYGFNNIKMLQYLQSQLQAIQLNLSFDFVKVKKAKYFSCVDNIIQQRISFVMPTTYSIYYCRTYLELPMDFDAILNTIVEE